MFGKTRLMMWNELPPWDIRQKDANDTFYVFGVFGVFGIFCVFGVTLRFLHFCVKGFYCELICNHSTICSTKPLSSGFTVGISAVTVCSIVNGLRDAKNAENAENAKNAKNAKNAEKAN